MMTLKRSQYNARKNRRYITAYDYGHGSDVYLSYDDIRLYFDNVNGIDVDFVPANTLLELLADHDILTVDSRGR